MQDTILAPSMPKHNSYPAGSVSATHLEEGDARPKHLGGALNPTGIAAAWQLQNLLWGSILAHNLVCPISLGAPKSLLQGRVALRARAMVRVVVADLGRGHLGWALQAGAVCSDTVNQGVCPQGGAKVGAVGAGLRRGHLGWTKQQTGIELL